MPPSCGTSGIAAKTRPARVGIGRPVEIHGMATVALGGRALILAADVARGALERGVRSREGIARIFQVIELRAEPRVRAMAGFAGRWEVERGVARLRRLKISVVA